MGNCCHVYAVEMMDYVVVQTLLQNKFGYVGPSEKSSGARRCAADRVGRMSEGGPFNGPPIPTSAGLPSLTTLVSVTRSSVAHIPTKRLSLPEQMRTTAGHCIQRFGKQKSLHAWFELQ